MLIQKIFGKNVPDLTKKKTTKISKINLIKTLVANSIILSLTTLNSRELSLME